MIKRRLAKKYRDALADKVGGQVAQRVIFGMRAKLGSDDRDRKTAARRYAKGIIVDHLGVMPRSAEKAVNDIIAALVPGKNPVCKTASNPRKKTTMRAKKRITRATPKKTVARKKPKRKAKPKPKPKAKAKSKRRTAMPYPMYGYYGY